MGGATLERTVQTVAATLVAETSLPDTLQLLADLGCEAVPAAVAATLAVVDEQGRATDAARSGGPSQGSSALDGDRLSVPLVASGATLGTITLYARDTETFTEGDARAAAIFAAQAAVVLANARAYWNLHDAAEGMQAAMQSRAVIEQAKGVLIATEACTADEAFALLARTSQRDNIKLRELARQIVDGTHDGNLAET